MTAPASAIERSSCSTDLDLSRVGVLGRWPWRWKPTVLNASTWMTEHVTAAARVESRRVRSRRRLSPHHTRLDCRATSSRDLGSRASPQRSHAYRYRIFSFFCLTFAPAPGRKELDEALERHQVELHHERAPRETRGPVALQPALADR
jgi:hypothetical protein